MRLFISLAVVALALPFLAGCSTVVDGQTQEITILTPGTGEAECTLDNGLNKYKTHGGSTIRVMRSDRDMIVQCYAVGNREQTVVTASKVNPWTAGNVVTGIIPGVAYDHFSGAMYAYPSVITVDFSGMRANGFSLPAYHNKDAPNPYHKGTEFYGTRDFVQGAPDPLNPSPAIDRKIRENTNPFSGDSTLPVFTPPPVNDSREIIPIPQPAGVTVIPAPVLSVAPRGQTAEALTREMNPSVFQP